VSIVVHHRCHHCGAAREGSGSAGWVRCQHCDAVIGFDFQAWLSSARYAAFLRESASPEVLTRWSTFEAHRLAALRLGARGLSEMEAAAEVLMALTPIVAPDEVTSDEAYRSRWRRYLAFTMLQQGIDPELSRLFSALQRDFASFDYRNPMPHLERAVSNLEQTHARLSQLDSPDDPDGLPWPLRAKVALSQFLTAYLHLLGPEDQRAVLERVYGREAVSDQTTQTGEADVLGLYLDWRCPACGLQSLQVRMVTEYTCPGCMFRKPVGHQESALPKVATLCGRCGASLTLERGERERACAFCQTWVRRVDRTGDVERDFSHELKARVAAQHGFTLEALPTEGQPGFPVTPETRRSLQLVGLTRIAAWHGSMVPAKRVRACIVATLGAPSEGLLAELEAAAIAEGNEGAMPVLREALGLP
jgi:DNA-directed RNA polymerase subunit RPC12/RpoP